MSELTEIPVTRLSEMTNYKIKKFTVDQLLKNLTLLAAHDSAVRAYLSFLEEGLITGSNLSGKSPVFGLGLEAKEEKIKPIPTLDEVRRFLIEAKIQKHPWYPIWAFAFLTGMRSGELKAFEWGDVDEKNGTWRNIDISSQLQEIISELKNARLNAKYVLPQHPEWKHGDAGKLLRMFLEHIGIKKDVVFHTLRAFFAIHLLSTGVEPLKGFRFCQRVVIL